MNPVIFTEFNRYSYLHVIFLIAAVTSIIMARIGTDLVYLVPFTLTALYLQAFFQNKVILPICLIALLPLMIFAQNGIVLYVMFTFAGIIHLQLFKLIWSAVIFSGLFFFCLADRWHLHSYIVPSLHLRRSSTLCQTRSLSNCVIQILR